MCSGGTHRLLSQQRARPPTTTNRRRGYRTRIPQVVALVCYLEGELQAALLAARPRHAHDDEQGIRPRDEGAAEGRRQRLGQTCAPHMAVAGGARRDKRGAVDEVVRGRAFPLERREALLFELEHRIVKSN